MKNSENSEKMMEKQARKEVKKTKCIQKKKNAVKKRKSIK